MRISSKLIDGAVEAFATLPGIGRKTALRMVLHLLKKDPIYTESFTTALSDMRGKVRFCKTCHNVSDDEQCQICTNPRRDSSTVCVVESIRDIMAIEETGQYQGTYHVLGGVISPIEGVGPDQLNIDTFLKRVEKGLIREVVLAISPTIEGDTTAFYLSKKLKDLNIGISTIARGVAFGGELEYVDELTLGRSIVDRIPYHFNGQ